jgi:hypothetical protein
MLRINGAGSQALKSCMYGLLKYPVNDVLNIGGKVWGKLKRVTRWAGGKC